MGAQISKQVERRKSISTEKKTLCDLKQSCGCDYPGCDYRPPDRKNWMSGLDPSKLPLNKIVWPGTHDSATNRIGIPFISRPFAQCQSLSIYRQLTLGARLIDVRVSDDRRVCHGILKTYSVDIVLRHLKKFLSETRSEIVVLEIRTEYGHKDPPDFDKYLESELGEHLIHHDDRLFGKTVAELLPRRVICIWKPRNSPQPGAGAPLWNAGYLKDNWIDTDLPSTKFESNMKHLGDQPSVGSRKYFYRVENTVTPQPDNPVLCVRPVTGRIHGYARLFIKQCFERGFADRLQVYSTDFIDEDFVDACVGLTYARIEGKMMEVIQKYKKHTSNAAKSDHSSLVGQLQDSNYVILGKQLDEKTQQLRQLRGEELEDLDFEQLCKLEREIERGQARVRQIKFDILHRELASLKRKELQLVRESGRMKEKVSSYAWYRCRMKKWRDL